MISPVKKIKSRQVAGEPESTVGMGATLLGYTDRHPLTIIEVTKGGKFIKVQRDNYTRVDNNGISEVQEYTFSENKEGAIYHFQQDRRGEWFEVIFNHLTKRWNRCERHRVRIGSREKYYDFSF